MPIVSDITSPIVPRSNSIPQSETCLTPTKSPKSPDKITEAEIQEPKQELNEIPLKIEPKPEPKLNQLQEHRIPINGTEISSMFQTLYCQDPPINSKDDFSHSSGEIKLESFVGVGLVEYFLRIFSKSTKSFLSFRDVSPGHLTILRNLSHQFKLELDESTSESTGQSVIILKKVT
jgi:hypothetical protein